MALHSRRSIAQDKLILQSALHISNYVFLRVVDRLVILTVYGFLEGEQSPQREAFHSPACWRGPLGLFLEDSIEKTT